MSGAVVGGCRTDAGAICPRGTLACLCVSASLKSLVLAWVKGTRFEAAAAPATVSGERLPIGHRKREGGRRVGAASQETCPWVSSIFRPGGPERALIPRSGDG